MTLFLHHGPHLAVLADELAEHLADPPDDPFEPVVIAVPTAGVRDWLGRRLAERLGVMANIRMPFPGRFLAAALGTPLDADDPWQVERLTWAVLDVLDAGAVDVPGWSRATRPSQSRRFAVARRLADLFDRYATIRPQVLQQWCVGAVGDGTVRVAVVGGAGGDDGDVAVVGGLDPTMAWQFHLWRAVRAHIGTPSPAERLPELVDQLRRGVIEPALPSTIAMFGVGVIAPAQLEVVTALADVRDVRMSVIHGSPVLWHRTNPLAPGRLVTRRRFDEASPAPADGHPLLRSWGRLGVETAALLRGVEAGGGAVVAAASTDAPDTPPATLLAHIQRDIQLDRPPTPYGTPDASIQVHACHGVTRQLEVLRDVLGHLFASDPTLEPRDVLVVCPDLDRFEPFAKAVFARGSLPVPLAVSDLSLGTENPVAAAMATIVRTVADRCTAVDVLAIAALEPVRQRLGISTDDLAQFATWADRLGTSWGLDAAHRANWIDIDIPSGTWDASLRSLLAGAAMPAPEPRSVFNGVLPYDDIGTDTLPRAGRLAELIARLRRCRDELASARSVAGWCDVLVELLGLLCATEPDDAGQLAQVLHAIDRIRGESQRGGAASRVVLERSDVLTLVDQLVAGSPGRLSLRSGRVTMTGMVPVRNVPARVVCLLGFDEVSLRPPGVDGDDVLALRPCVGERDRRAEHRQLVLDAVMAAGEHLVVVCDGNDVTTNRRLRFPVQLAELLDVVDATLGRTPGDPLTRGVVVHHPLRAFDDRNFTPGGVTAARDVVFGFDDTMRAAAEARRVAHDGGAAPTPLRWSIAGPVPSAVTLAQLTEACTRPARTLVRDGLDVRLPGEVERQDSNIPLSVSPLESASLGQRLLHHYRGAAAQPDLAGTAWEGVARAGVDAWTRSEALRAGSPPRLLIHQSLEAVRREVDQLVAAAAACVPGVSEADIVGAGESIDVDVALRYAGRAVGTAAGAAPPRLAGELRLTDVVAGIAGSTICRLSYRRPKSRVVVGAALDLAAAVVATGRDDWQALTVTRGASGSTPPVCQLLHVAAGDPVAAAMSLLETAAELRVAALTGAVPLFEETSKTLHGKGFIDEEILLGNGFVPGDMGDAHTQFVWGSVTTAEMLRLTPTPLALARMLWSAVHWFAGVAEPVPTRRAGR